MVNGIAYSSVFHVGASMVYGIRFSAIFLKTLIYKMFPWMAQLLGHMLAQLERHIALLRMKRLGVPKVSLVVRFTRFVMACMPIKFILTGGQEAECKQYLYWKMLMLQPF